MSESVGTTLGDLVELVADKTAMKDPSKPYLGLEHIESQSNRLLGWAAATESTSVNCIFLRDDVLFGKLRPRLRKCIRAPFDGYCSTDILVLRARPGVVPAYAFYQTASEPTFRRAIRTEEGTRMPRTSWEAIRVARFPAHRDEEQQAIAGVLGQIDAAIIQTERCLAKLRLIKAGLLHDLLMCGIDSSGSVRSDPSTSRLVSFSSIIDVNPPTESSGVTEDAEVSFVPMCDVSEDGRWDHRQTRPLHAIKAGFTPFRENDVLFAKITPCMENGKGMHAVNTVNGIGFASTEFHVLRARDNNVARFVYWWTMMPSLRIKAAGRMTGSAGQQRVPADFFDWWHIPYRDPDEQRIIADRLDEMESRISREQAALAKLNMLKQGLMHDLLTGLVRVPYELGTTAADDNASDAPRSERKTNIYFMRSVLAAEIVEQMHEHATFGHVKFQKTLFLCERVAGLDLETRYHRAAAGPHDNRLMRSVDGQMEKQRWFRKVPRGVGPDGKPLGWAYERMEKSGGHREWFEKYWAAARERIQRVIDMLRPLDTRRCEVVATLYSAWEDLLAAGREATDDAIVNEVLTNWHESKQAIPRERWAKALSWMREQGVTP